MGVAAVALGDRRRIGLWILPLFLITALIGAVLAGGLVVLYYAQRVAALEEETRYARQEVLGTRDQVTAAAQEARDAIAELVDEAQDDLAVTAPLEEPADGGVYAVSAAHGGGELRVATAFAVYSDAAEGEVPDPVTFLVTSYALVREGTGAVAAATVHLPDGPVEATVSGVEPDYDLATLRLPGRGGLPVLPWRPPDARLVRGDPVWLVGVAGPDTPVVVPATLGGVSPRALVVSTTATSFLAGGPFVDASGRVVAVASVPYAPFGPAGTPGGYAVPIRALCLELVECTVEDTGGGDPLGVPGQVVPGAIARPSPTPASASET